MGVTKIYLVENCYGDHNSVYIGKTKNSRENDHKITYGHQIKYTVIDEVNSLKRKYWKPIETMWIQSFISWGFNVVNINKEGGSGPEFVKEETKNKNSLGNIGKSKQGVSDKLKGRQSPHKIDTGIKISNSKKGMVLTEDWKEKISNNTKGNKNRLGTTHSSKTKQKMSELKKGKIRPNIYKPVIQLDQNDNIISNFNSVTEAAESTGCYKSAITMCCNGKLKQTKGFKFKYK